MTLLARWEGLPVQEWMERWGVPHVEVHDALGSTNDRARELADAGATPFTVVIAVEQTAGRGRGGSSWHSAPGAGLWLSTLLPLAGVPPPYLPLLMGLSAAAALEHVAPMLHVGVKWPNDLEIDGGKVGGVLCEYGRGSAIAGIGLNVSQTREDFPPDVSARAVSLEMMGAGRVSVAALAGALLRQLRERGECGRWPFPAEAREELAARDVMRDRAVRTQQAGDGLARGIDADGALLLDQEGGRRVRVIAGSVRIQ